MADRVMWRTMAPRYLILAVSLTILVASLWALAENVANTRPADGGVGATTRSAARDGSRRRPLTVPPSHPADVILGRPTANSIVLSVLCDSDATAVIAYGTQLTDLSARTPVKHFKKGEPQEILLEN